MNGEVQGDGHEGLFAAGQQRDGLQLLAGRLDLDLDAAVQNVVLVLQLQPGLAAAEQLQKRLLKALVEQPELLGEDLRHLAGDLVDDARQLLLGLLHVRPLARTGRYTGYSPGRTPRWRPMLGVPSALDLPVQLPDAAGGLGDALQLHALAPEPRSGSVHTSPTAYPEYVFSSMAAAFFCCSSRATSRSVWRTSSLQRCIS